MQSSLLPSVSMSTIRSVAAPAQVPSEVQTPLWGNSAAANGEEPSGEAAKSASGEAEGNGADKDGGEKDKGGEGAAPKTWRGVASFQARAFPSTAPLHHVGISQLCSCRAFRILDRSSVPLTRETTLPSNVCSMIWFTWYSKSSTAFPSNCETPPRV